MGEREYNLSLNDDEFAAEVAAMARKRGRGKITTDEYDNGMNVDGGEKGGYSPERKRYKSKEIEIYGEDADMAPAVDPQKLTNDQQFAEQ